MKPKRQRVKVQDIVVLAKEDLTCVNDFSVDHDIHKFLHPSDAVQQIAVLKKVTDELISTEDGHTSSNTIYILIAAFMVCPIKNPTKRVIASCLQKLAVKEQLAKCIRNSISAYLQRKFSQLKNFSELHDIQHVIENISMLLENFPLGEEALTITSEDVVIFMTEALSRFYMSIRCESVDPVTKGDYMHCCLRVVKNLTKFLPKVHDVLLNSHNSHLTLSQRNFVELISGILADENFLMDCRTTCGMALPLMFKLHGGKDYITKILYHLFPSYTSSRDTHDHDLLGNNLDLWSWQNDLDLLSQLCLLNGCLAILEDDDLVVNLGQGQYIITHVFGKELAHIISKLTDTSTKLMASRTLVQWTIKANNCMLLAQTQQCEMLVRQLVGDAELMQHFMTYAWNHWEDPTDALRHQAVAIFQNIVKCHCRVTEMAAKDDKFLINLTSSLLALDWSSKGKYEPLCALVDLLTSKHLLTLNPDLPKVILQASGESAVAPYANELLEKLFTSHKRELSVTEHDQAAAWNDIWVLPVLDVICSGNKRLKQNVVQYTIPKLLKCSPESLIYIMDKLQNNSYNHHSVGALVTCLKSAKMMGILSKLPEAVGNGWADALPPTLMRHPEEEVRLDTYGLLCESIKTTEVVSEQDLRLIRSFLPLNLFSQNPAFRQQLAAYSKKLFIRLKESCQPLVKLSRKTGDEAAGQHLQRYKAFVCWMCDMLCGSIHQGASFPARTTALSIFSTMVSIFTVNSNAEDQIPWKFVVEHMTACKAQTLIECLNDTFDSNKQEAYYILKTLPTSCLGLQEKAVSDLLDVALDLASSTNPQECSVAAYLFRLLILQPSLCDVIAHVTSVDQSEAEKSDHLPATNQSDVEQLGEMPSVNKSPADTLQLRQCLRKATKVHVTQLKESRDENFRRLQLLQVLLCHLEDQLKVAKQSLVYAAATRPMYPALHCIRQILEDTDLRSVAHVTEWQHLIERLVNTSFQIAEVVSPVVHNSSPEGNVPEESILGPGLSFGAMTNSDQGALHEAIQDSAATVCLMPEYLVVCCWRSIKEVSLMLGQLTQSSPIAQSGAPGLITINKIEEIGEFFTVQLLESRHRGAFELAYSGFVKMTDMLWRCRINTVHILPSRWLEEVMQDIKSCDPNSRLCSTRRSAGVPFYVQALVSTEPNLQGRPCFRKVTTELLSLARPSPANQQSESTAQVHALNILRTLFKDTRLAEDVFPFIGEGLEVAVLGYASKLWSVRNSSTLLFSCLMTRIFGVKRSKDESSRKNCLTGRVFFHRFPSLFPFLLDQLTQATVDIGDMGKLHPGLYPVLMVLGRLVPSVLEATEPNINLAAFIPHVRKCGSSAVFKTRLMSARALAPLVGCDHLTHTLQVLVDILLSEARGQNLLHGTLLQLEEIVKALGDLTGPMMANIATIVIPSVHSAADELLTAKNKCLVTRATFLDLASAILHTRWPDLSPDVKRHLDTLHKTVVDVSLSETENPNWSLCTPGLSAFYETITVVLLENYDQFSEEEFENLILKLLASQFYEVRLLTLNLLDHVNENSTEESTNWLDAEEKSWNLDMSSMQKIDKAMQNSVKVQKHLRFMSTNEKYPECLSQTLKVLASYTRWSAQVSETPSGVIQTLQYLMDLSENAQDDVAFSALEFSGCLVECLYNIITKEGCETSKALLGKWLQLLQERSRMEVSFSSRMTCVKVMLHNACLLLLDPHNILGEGCFDMWMVVLRLLQDEEADIRSTMATVVLQLASHINLGVSGAVQSEYALELCLKVITSELGPQRWTEVFNALLRWTLYDLEPDLNEAVKGVRLFDRSELNTYRDGLVFSKLTAGYLSALLDPEGGLVPQAREPGMTGAPVKEPRSLGLSGLDLKHSTMQMNEITSGENCLPAGSNHLQLQVTLHHAVASFIKQSNSTIDQDCMSFLHTTTWKENMTNLCRLHNVYNALKRHENFNLTAVKLSLQKACNFLKTAVQNLPANYLLQQISDELDI